MSGILEQPSQQNSGQWRAAAGRWTVLVSMGLVLGLIGTFLLACPSHVHRRALLTCVHCGNIREVQVVQRWWMINAAVCRDSADYPVPTGHVHRWYQYNSKLQTSFSYTGWTRNQYETGGLPWKGDVSDRDLTRSPGQLREQWLP